MVRGPLQAVRDSSDRLTSTAATSPARAGRPADMRKPPGDRAYGQSKAPRPADNRRRPGCPAGGGLNIVDSPQPGWYVLIIGPGLPPTASRDYPASPSHPARPELPMTPASASPP